MSELVEATKTYGSLSALDGCTFRAQPGRLTGFLGPNGAGKTTAMRAVFGLVELDAGTVRWQGRLVSRERGSGLRRVMYGPDRYIVWWSVVPTVPTEITLETPDKTR